MLYHHQVRFQKPDPPFSIKHSKHNFKPRYFIGLPVTFAPVKPGRYESTLVIETDVGHSRVAELRGECVAPSEVGHILWINVWPLPKKPDLRKWSKWYIHFIPRLLVNQRVQFCLAVTWLDGWIVDGQGHMTILHFTGLMRFSTALCTRFSTALFKCRSACLPHAFLDRWCNYVTVRRKSCRFNSILEMFKTSLIFLIENCWNPCPFLKSGTSFPSFTVQVFSSLNTMGRRRRHTSKVEYTI